MKERKLFSDDRSNDSRTQASTRRRTGTRPVRKSSGLAPHRWTSPELIRSFAPGAPSAAYRALNP